MINEICTVPQLVIRVDPVSGESPRGYLCRVAHTHRYSGPNSILHIACICGEDLERAKGMERISRVLRLEPEEWRQMCYRELAGRKGKRQRSFCGEYIKYSDLNYGYPRLCPACLRERPIWWAVWDLGLVTACPLHRCFLLHQCPNCGRKLLWQRPAVYVCHCGQDFRDLPAKDADKDVLAINTLIYRAAAFPVSDGVEQALSNYCFPQAMLKLRLGSLLRLVLLLGCIEEKRRLRGTNMIVDNRDPAAATEKCRAAVAMLRDWPGPLSEALQNMLPTDTDNPDILKFNKIFGRFYTGLFQELPRRKFGFLLDVFEKVVIKDWKGFIRASHRRPRYFSPMVLQSSHWVSLHQAARLARVSDRRILDFIRQGQLEHIFLSRQYWITRESLERWIVNRHLEVARYMSTSEVQDALGLDYKSVRKLAQAGIIRYVKGYDELFSSGYHYLRDDVMKIVCALQRRAVPRRKYTDPRELILFRDVPKYVGAHRFPDVVRAVVDGDLVPVAYAKLFRGSSGYLFPLDKLRNHQRISTGNVAWRKLMVRASRDPNWAVSQATAT